jgi:predicted DsbA family dithiol-disulfide isomerase
VFLRAAALCLGCDDAGEDSDRAALAAFDGLTAEVRRAFFERALDVSRMDVLLGLLGPSGPASDEVRGRIDSGEAYAALHRDEQLMKAYGVQGSPTYVFNEGRQLLYGNVGYRIIDANVRELLSAPPAEGAPSWC